MDQRSIYQRYEAVLDQANARWRAGEHRAAAVLLRLLLVAGPRALSKWPNYRLALALLAACLGESGQFREGLQYQAELMTTAPGNREIRDNFVKMIEDAADDLPDRPLFQEAILTVMDRLDLSRLAVTLSLTLLNRPQRVYWQSWGDRSTERISVPLLPIAMIFPDSLMPSAV